ncbi:hypothetical protein ACOSP7_003220 [Xanthoceras sorbifolium]
MLYGVAASFRGGFSVDVGETLAVLEGVRLATTIVGFLLSLNQIPFKVVKLCNGELLPRCEIANVIQDHLLLRFPECCVAHVPSFCNSLALFCSSMSDKLFS